MKAWKSLLLVAVFWVTPLGTRSAVLGQSPVCEGEGGEAAPAAISAVFVREEKLVLSVSWSQGAALRRPVTLEVLDRRRTVVASRTVEMLPGQHVAYEMTAGQSFFEAHGYWFTARVLDPAGKLLGKQVPALVTFCEPSAGCVYEVVEGVGSQTLAAGSELHQLLEQLVDQGSRDLLHEAISAAPHLDHQIYWLASQLQHLVYPLAGAECTCLWQTEYLLNPTAQGQAYSFGEALPEMDGPDWEVSSLDGPGSNFLLAAQLLGGELGGLDVDTDARLALHLQCFKIASWAFASWAGMAISVPVLAPCLKGCTVASITISAQAESRVSASALASPANGALAAASATAELFLNDQPAAALFAAGSAQVDRLPGDEELASAQQDSGLMEDSWTFPGGFASATFVAQGSLEICLDLDDSATGCLGGSFSRPADDSGPWAYGCAASNTAVSMTGTASCAMASTQEASFWTSDGPPLDGLLILPWRP
ncbi:MAG: hypothetical protein KDD47_17290 [Acidobacteria bacterium]|nr:hypothetical protein [Acidobacteriota bacterium]